MLNGDLPFRRGKNAKEMGWNYPVDLKYHMSAYYAGIFEDLTWSKCALLGAILSGSKLRGGYLLWWGDIMRWKSLRIRFGSCIVEDCSDRTRSSTVEWASDPFPNSTQKSIFHRKWTIQKRGTWQSIFIRVLGIVSNQASPLLLRLDPELHIIDWVQIGDGEHGKIDFKLLQWSDWFFYMRLRMPPNASWLVMAPIGFVGSPNEFFGRVSKYGTEDEKWSTSYILLSDWPS